MTENYPVSETTSGQLPDAVAATADPELPGMVKISDATPLDTAQLREHPVFVAADPERKVPDIVLTSAPISPRDRPHRNETRIGIQKGGEKVGALNLKQLPNHTWVRDILVDRDRQGEGLGVAAYLGVIAAAHEAGRRVESDPAGLSPDPTGESPARRVWGSLVRRGVAEVVEGQDQHGNPRYVSKPPQG